jgi:hypothetical protein
MMRWILIGYFPKRRAARSGWVSPYPDYPDAGFPAPVPVEEICSVSQCIAAGPEPPWGEINEFGGYQGPAAAWQAVPPNQRQEFNLFAYRIAPVLYRDGQEEELDLPALNLVPLPDAFDCLGYDAVELADGWQLGCSPMSCNGQTGAAVLNAYCLVGTAEEGIALARTFSVTEPEPGPYIVVEVWRDRGRNAGADPSPH